MAQDNETPQAAPFKLSKKQEIVLQSALHALNQNVNYAQSVDHAKDGIDFAIAQLEALKNSL